MDRGAGGSAAREAASMLHGGGHRGVVVDPQHRLEVVAGPPLRPACGGGLAHCYGRPFVASRRRLLIRSVFVETASEQTLLFFVGERGGQEHASDEGGCRGATLDGVARHVGSDHEPRQRFAPSRVADAEALAGSVVHSRVLSRGVVDGRIGAPVRRLSLLVPDGDVYDVAGVLARRRVVAAPCGMRAARPSAQYPSGRRHGDRQLVSGSGAAAALRAIRR
jgi:hypothetical protein